jgi:hypothetical protein
MNKLEIESFRKLTLEQKIYLQEKYPDLYNYLNEVNKNSLDYKTFKQLEKYSKMCKPNKIPNLSKKELIKCLYRKLPYLERIKQADGIQYKQFLSSFLNILRYKYTHFVTNSDINYYFDMGKVDEYGPKYNPISLPYNRYHEIKVHNAPTTGMHSTFYDYVTLENFSTMIKILYPKFNNQEYINSLVSACNPAQTTNLYYMFRLFPNGKYKLNGKVVTPDTIVISLEKLYKFLVAIGNKMSQEANTYTHLSNQEKEMYSRNYKFSQDQVNRFLLAFPKEIYIDFLLKSDIRPRDYNPYYIM